MNYLKENKNTYYYKKLKGYINQYYIGYINQYNHEVVLIIDVSEFLNFGRKSLSQRFIDRLIRFLEKRRKENWKVDGKCY